MNAPRNTSMVVETSLPWEAQSRPALFRSLLEGGQLALRFPPVTCPVKRPPWQGRRRTSFSHTRVLTWNECYLLTGPESRTRTPQVEVCPHTSFLCFSPQPTGLGCPLNHTPAHPSFLSVLTCPASGLGSLTLPEALVS